MTVRLIATDLDGTLLRPDGNVSNRTRTALDAARAAGMIVVPVTARQPLGLGEIAEQAGFTEWALCSNGALGTHLSTGEVLFVEHLPVVTQRRLADALISRLPGVLFVSVRNSGEAFVAQHGYARHAAFDDHKRDPSTMAGHSLDTVLAEESLKLIVRHPDLTPEALQAEVSALGLTGFAVTRSGAPFLEVNAPHVTKASGLQRLCRLLEIDQADVIAFGDAPNDAEMLAWAGIGIAMGHAGPEATAAADELTLDNVHDGVAVVIEDLITRQELTS